MLSVDPLHGHSEWFAHSVRKKLHFLEMLEQCRTVVPGHRITSPRDVVAMQCGSGNADDVCNPDAGCEGKVFIPDAFERGTVPGDRIHLVHDYDDIADAEQRDDMSVASSSG